MEITAQASTGREAIEAIRAARPDLAFLDVQMPGLTGIDVVEEVGPQHMPLVVFVTAYDEYAVEAFDVAAIDYLLKPFDDARFEEALSRARDEWTRRTAADLQDRLRKLLASMDAASDTSDEKHERLERLAVEERDRTRIVPIEQIDFISASGKYCYLHVKGERLLADEQMKYLEEHLPPDQFFRLHRSHIVRLDAVEMLLVRPGGDYSVQLHSGEHVKASRSRWDELAVRLGIRIKEPE